MERKPPMIRSRVLGVAFALAGLVVFASTAVLAQDDAKAAKEKAKVGKPAPDFALKDLRGKEFKLSKVKGKVVVLEWFNPECPSVETAHGKGGSLRKLPGTHMKKNKVVWWAVNSSAPGKEGSGVDTNKKYARKFRMRYPVLIDENGQVGRLFGATMTPEIFVIDKTGKLVYRGAEDNQADVKAGKADDYVNYVDAVIEALKKGEKLPYTTTKPAG